MRAPQLARGRRGRDVRKGRQTEEANSKLGGKRKEGYQQGKEISTGNGWFLRVGHPAANLSGTFSMTCLSFCV